MQPVFRFAPSPNGALHLGHAYSALVTAQLASDHDGRFLLRIEDIDHARSKPAFEEQILEDLAWLGLTWEQPVRRQSEHFEEYTAALEALKVLGIVYPSYATRGEIKSALARIRSGPRDPDGQPVYPVELKALDRERAADHASARTAHTWRLDAGLARALAAEKCGRVPAFQENLSGPGGEHGTVAVDLDLWGDIVIARKDVPTSYHLSVVVDDAIQGITHVSRGQDLFYATHIHTVLQILLGLPGPRYCHHGLIRDETGRRLSKSAGDLSLRALRRNGAGPAEIRAMVGLDAPDRELTQDRQV